MGVQPSLEDEGRSLQLESALLARRVNAIGRPLTEAESARVVEESASLRRRIAAWMTRKTIENRPEVISRGAPTSHVEAVRGLREARRVLEERKSFQRGCSDCPAANDLGGGGVRCGIEHTILRPESDPMSLATFCHGDHTACPTWRAEREKTSSRPLVADTEGAV